MPAAVLKGQFIVLARAAVQRAQNLILRMFRMAVALREVVSRAEQGRVTEALLAPVFSSKIFRESEEEED